MNTAMDVLRSRLEGWRRCGKGWRCDCPVGHRSRGTLSIGEGDNGMVLIHCFAGCSPAEVLDALGLDLRDLFPERVRPATPQQRRQAQQAVRSANVAAAVAVLAREATVLEIAAHHLAGGLPIAADDLQRLAEATARIQAARAVLQ